jgi:hypothetical protein
MVYMQFALRIICNRRITETVKERVAGLTNYLFLSDNLNFIPYWKDNECAILELSAKIENPDYSKIQQYIQAISGTENLSQRCVPDEWECAYFASLDELHSSKNTAFVVCSIF